MLIYYYVTTYTMDKTKWKQYQSRFEYHCLSLAKAILSLALAAWISRNYWATRNTLASVWSVMLSEAKSIMLKKWQSRIELVGIVTSVAGSEKIWHQKSELGSNWKKCPSLLLLNVVPYLYIYCISGNAANYYYGICIYNRLQHYWCTGETALG